VWRGGPHDAVGFSWNRHGDFGSHGEMGAAEDCILFLEFVGVHFDACSDGHWLVYWFGGASFISTDNKHLYLSDE
jgi:hypothetical protein